MSEEEQTRQLITPELHVERTVEKAIARYIRRNKQGE
jgi:hypothetical protein